MADTAPITMLPVHHLHESPFNPRRTFREQGLQELAADITAQGVLSPLLVRPRVPPLFATAPDATCGHELVFGHRRLRAAHLAGLTHVPCMVQAMTDEQAKRAQISENLGREDVHAIEEAEGFQALIDDSSDTADTLATRYGKSRSYIYGRLKLLQLCPEVRAAVLAGEIGTEVGLLVARVGGPKMQAKALGYIKGKALSLEDGGKQSFRRIRDLLNERFTLDLKDAIFDVDDEMLLPSAGYCGRCPKRSGNAPEFADVTEAAKPDRHWTRLHTGADICTDPDCFDAKRRAHLAREATKLEAAGNVVVTGNKARAALAATGEVKGDYVDAAKARDALKKAKHATTGKALAMPDMVMLQNQITGKLTAAVKRADLQQLGATMPEPGRRNSAADSAATRRHQAADQAKLAADQAKLAAENTRRRAVLDQVREATRATPRGEFDLRLVAHVALAGVPWPDRALLAELWACTRDTLETHVDTLAVADTGQFLLDCALVISAQVAQVYYITDQPEQLLAAAAHYGIATAADTAHSTPTPSTAGAGAKRATPPSAQVDAFADAHADAQAATA